MGSATYPLHAIVLRRTKLAETDIIATLLAEDGAIVEAVAKGARKPSSPFSARLEIFAEVDILAVRGKSLDIVKEARLIDAHRDLIADVEHAAAAAPVADAAARLCQPGLPAPKVFALTSSVFSHMESCDEGAALALCAAYLLKVCSFSGFRPSFRRCVLCGAPIALNVDRVDRNPVVFSAADGGTVCAECLSFSDTVRVPCETLAWADYLLMATFDEAVRKAPPVRVSFEVLRLCRLWLKEHADVRLKSLEFLLGCGLF